MQKSQIIRIRLLSIFTIISIIYLVQDKIENFYNIRTHNPVYIERIKKSKLLHRTKIYHECRYL